MSKYPKVIPSITIKCDDNFFIGNESYYGSSVAYKATSYVDGKELSVISLISKHMLSEMKSHKEDIERQIEWGLVRDIISKLSDDEINPKVKMLG